jgi:hypothetical protein
MFDLGLKGWLAVLGAAVLSTWAVLRLGRGMSYEPDADQTDGVEVGGGRSRRSRRSR